MKTLLALLVAAPVVALAPNSLDDPTTRQEWMDQYRQAAEVNSTDRMAKLIDDYQEFAVQTIVYTCEQIAEGSSDKLEKDIAGLRKGWREGMKTRFVDEVYEYFSLLRPEYKRTRRELRVRYERQVEQFNAATEDGNKNAFPGLYLELNGLGGAFGEIGDHYASSQAFVLAAICQDERSRGDDAEFQLAHDAYVAAVEAREKVELQDDTWQQSKDRATHLVENGLATPPGADPADAGPEASGPEAGAEVTVAMSFELLDDVEQFDRPIYTNDQVHAGWKGVYLTTVGSSSAFQALEGGVRAIREGASRVMIDQDGDGEGDVEVPMLGKIVPVEIELGEGAEQRPWAFFVRTGDQQDYYQGIQMNLEPNDTNISLYVVNAGSMVGTIGETPVRVLDDNMDGIYGSAPKSWAELGTTEGNYQQDVDSILVGKDKAARPWSSMVDIDGQWYELESKDAGTSLAATPMSNVQTGTLRLKAKGVKPSWVIVQGVGENRETLFFDLMQNGGKGVEVPVGRYQLFCGFVEKGKRRDITKTLILPGTSTPIWTVPVGETVDIELGQPFGFDFEYVEGDDTVKILGDTVVVTGAAGERYERAWGCVAEPSVSVRRAGTRSGSKPEDMRIVTGQDEITNLGWGAAWFPLDIEVPRPAGDVIEVQLTQKKHDLFGKIESEWR